MSTLWVRRYDREERQRRFDRWASLPRWRWLARRRAFAHFRAGLEMARQEDPVSWKVER